MEEIDIEWIMRTAKADVFIVHLRFSEKRGRHTNIVFKTVELNSKSMESPRGWPVGLVAGAMLKANEFIRVNEHRMFLGARVSTKKAERKPVQYIPAEE